VHPGRTAAKTDIIAGLKKNISDLSITGRTDTGNGLTIGTDRMSATGTITENIMIVIGRPTGQRDTLLSTIVIITKPKDTLLSISVKTTDGLRSKAITAIKTIINITVNIAHPTMYIPTGRRPTIRDFPSPSRQKAGGKLNKFVRRYIIEMIYLLTTKKRYRSKACLMSN